jgi:fatty-acyl-CoA synthase
VSFTILGAMRWWARDIPDKIALSIDGDAVAYAELYGWARAAALRLQTLGVEPGDRIGLVGSQSLPYFVLALGVQFIGGVAVPLNIRYTERELSGALEDTTPRLVFAEAGYYELCERTMRGHDGVTLRRLDEIQDWRDSASAPFGFEADRDTPIAIMSTSGSTARPKFVTFTHDMIVSIALELQLIEPTTRQGKAFLVAPPFSGGLYTTMEYLVLGCSCYLQCRFDAELAIRLIEQERINIFPGSTVFMERIAATACFSGADLSSITWATIGGARVPQRLIDLFRRKGVTLRCLFGQTEAGGAWAATGKAADKLLQVGYGGPFTEWKIDRDGESVGPNEVGEILIRGPSVTSRYWNNPEATAQTMRNGWLYTGDLGLIDAEGSLTFVDRLKDIIISGGLKISAAEVEQVISGIDGIVAVSVIAAEDPKFGETPLAVIHANRSIDPMHVIQHCNENLANYKVPRYLAFETDPLPRLASGKISKPALREKYRNAAAELPKLR